MTDTPKQTANPLTPEQAAALLQFVREVASGGGDFPDRARIVLKRLGLPR